MLDEDLAEQRRELAELDRASARRFFNTDEPPLPTFLYKYMRSGHDAVHSFLVKSEFFMASHRRFNDPFEFAAKIDVPSNPRDLEKALILFLGSQRMDLPDAVERAREMIAEGNVSGIYQDALESAAASLGVTCLSAASRTPGERKMTSPRHPLLWAHYADSHKGICLQFHTTRDPGFFGEFQPVRYSDDFLHLPIDVDKATRHMQLQRLLHRKSSAWAYEHEYRRIDEAMAGQMASVRAEALTGVVLGVRCVRSDLQNVKRALNARHLAGLPKLKVFRCQPHQSAYRFTMVRATETEQQIYG